MEECMNGNQFSMYNKSTIHHINSLRLSVCSSKELIEHQFVFDLCNSSSSNCKWIYWDSKYLSCIYYYQYGVLFSESNGTDYIFF